MPEPRNTVVAVLLGLAIAAFVPTHATAQTEPGQPFALRLSIEMAAHRRLVEIMHRTGHVTAPFTTDGCSGGLSMAWDLIADFLPVFARTHKERPPWEACCVTHDWAYHAAGGARTAEDSHRARVLADEALRECVLDTGARRTPYLSETYGVTEGQITGAYAIIADAMFDAVRLGGGPCSGMPWRWGYGYPTCLLGK